MGPPRNQGDADDNDGDNDEINRMEDCRRMSATRLDLNCGSLVAVTAFWPPSEGNYVELVLCLGSMRLFIIQSRLIRPPTSIDHPPDTLVIGRVDIHDGPPVHGRFAP